MIPGQDISITPPHSFSLRQSSHAAYFFAFNTFALSRFRTVRSNRYESRNISLGRPHAENPFDYTGWSRKLTSCRRHTINASFSPLHAPDHL